MVAGAGDDVERLSALFTEWRMTGEDAGASHGGGHEVLPSSAVLYTFVMLVLGAACKFVAKDVPIPYTAMLLMWGLFMGSIDFFFDTGPVDLSIAAWTSIDPHLFLFIFIFHYIIFKVVKTRFSLLIVF